MAAEVNGQRKEKKEGKQGAELHGNGSTVTQPLAVAAQPLETALGTPAFGPQGPPAVLTSTQKGQFESAIPAKIAPHAPLCSFGRKGAPKISSNGAPPSSRS